VLNPPVKTGKISLALALALAFCLSTRPAGAAAAPSEDLAAAQRLLDEGQPAQAVKVLAKARSAQGLLLRSTAALMAGDEKAGRRDLDRALAVDPTLRQAWQNRAALAIADRRYDAAWSDFLRAQQIDPRAAVGTVWLVNSVTTASTIAGTSYAWGTRVVWGDRIIWGNQLFYNDPAWALRIVWGDRIIWGNRIIWGDSLVLTERVIWGDRIIWGNALVGYNDPAFGLVWGDRIIWGNVVDANHIIWGNAATVLSPMALANLIQ